MKHAIIYIYVLLVIMIIFLIIIYLKLSNLENICKQSPAQQLSLDYKKGLQTPGISWVQDIQSPADYKNVQLIFYPGVYIGTLDTVYTIGSIVTIKAYSPGYDEQQIFSIQTDGSTYVSFNARGGTLYTPTTFQCGTSGFISEYGRLIDCTSPIVTDPRVEFQWLGD